MKIQLRHNAINYECDLSAPIDISLSVGQVKCFYAPDLDTAPYESGAFIGSVKAGAPVNFYNVFFNPHGNGTHTESLGHITTKQESVNKQLKSFHFVSYLVSVPLEKKGKADQVINLAALKKALGDHIPKAIIIRTRPNRSNKRKKDYSGTNPPYMEAKAMRYLVKIGVEHVLIDLPSVDREVDKGKLAAHHIFWGLEKNAKKKRSHCTITELIFVDNSIKDGWYFLNLQIAPFELDASPSKPIIYQLNKI